MGRVMLLTDVIEMRDRQWDACETSLQRAKLRAAYVAAGWTICPHETCPPHNCRVQRTVWSEADGIID